MADEEIIPEGLVLHIMDTMSPNQRLVVAALNRELAHLRAEVDRLRADSVRIRASLVIGDEVGRNKDRLIDQLAADLQLTQEALVRARTAIAVGDRWAPETGFAFPVKTRGL